MILLQYLNIHPPASYHHHHLPLRAAYAAAVAAALKVQPYRVGQREQVLMWRLDLVTLTVSRL